VNDRCPECGFVYDPTLGEVAAATVEGADELAGLMRDPPAGIDLRARRDSTRWSPIEYACHVRDLLLVQRERVLLARRVEGTGFAPMGRDERVDHDGYASQRPADVARQLQDAARLYANVLARLEPADWFRKVIYNFPDPTERDVRWMALHTLHEVRHHLGDVTAQLPSAEPGSAG
jgi:hypothetical protein